MGWGQPHIGTTGEVAEAHAAFDRVGIPAGNLAERAKEAAKLIVAYTCDGSRFCPATAHTLGCFKSRAVDL